jgi:hypothetical protein
MPTERVLVGGGTSYSNSNVASQYQKYYQFRWYDTYDIIGNPGMGNGSLNYPYGNTCNNYGSMNPSSLLYTINTNRLFTGFLPYQNPYDFYYYNIASYPIDLYFDFGFPVVITKYRMWNGFTTGVVGPISNQENGSRPNLSELTPKSWILYGSNDGGLTWTSVNTQTNVSVFPYPSSRKCSESSYSEFSTSSTTAYKTYKLTVTRGGLQSQACNKGGCSTISELFQIGEIQLLGYEDPTASCSLHGYDVLFPGASSSMSGLFGVTRLIRGPNKNMSLLFDKPVWGPYNVSSSSVSGTVDFGTNVTLTQYKMKGGVSFYAIVNPTAWKVYGSSNNSTWTLIHNVTSGSVSSSFTSFNISSPGSYRYYKLELVTGTQVNALCDKGGCPRYAGISDLQLLGYLS